MSGDVARPPRQPRPGRGFTLIEMLVVIAILALLASLLAPSLGNARRRAQATACASRQRHCAVAMMQHADDHESYLSPVGHAAGWDGVNYTEWWYANRWIGRYLDTGENSLVGVRCPGVKRYGIGFNHPQIGIWLNPLYPRPTDYLYRITEVTLPDATVAFADVAVIANPNEPDPSKWTPVDPEIGNVFFRTPDNQPWYDSSPSRAINRHGGTLAAAFIDGHAAVMSVMDIGFTEPIGDPKALWDRR